MQTGVEFLFIIIILHELLLTATLACCGRCEGAKVWGRGGGGVERTSGVDSSIFDSSLGCQRRIYETVRRIEKYTNYHKSKKTKNIKTPSALPEDLLKAVWTLDRTDG